MDHTIPELLACCGFHQHAFMQREVCTALWFMDKEQHGEITDAIAYALGSGGTERRHCEQRLARLLEDFCLLEDVRDCWRAGRLPQHVVTRLRLEIARRNFTADCGTELEDLLAVLA